jgi:transglutaminase-like putative cysteine protease
MSTAQTVREVVERIVVGMATEPEKAIALHDYVRDHIKFGFTRYFDAAEPDYTLSRGVGHYNPKSELMVALFRVAGLEAYQHFVAIRNDILKGAFPPSRSWMLLPVPELGHSYAEVKVEGTWRAIDSYIVDTTLLQPARARLAKESRSLGYGTRVDATNVWDGRSDAFSQFDQGMMVEDHGRVDELEAYFRTNEYRNQVLGLRFNRLFKLIGDVSVAPINAHLEGIRTSCVE